MDKTEAPISKVPTLVLASRSREDLALVIEELSNPGLRDFGELQRVDMDGLQLWISSVTGARTYVERTRQWLHYIGNMRNASTGGADGYPAEIVSAVHNCYLTWWRL